MSKHRIKKIWDKGNLLYLFLIIVPFIITIRSVLSGTTPFWFDPARDFLAAWENLNKPTLIGPPTGIPGVFYGPYWIWLISLCLIVSKDPRFVTLLLLTIPYFTLFPLLLYKLGKSFKYSSLIIFWGIFIITYPNYATHLWNPHLAPLIYLTFMYLLLTTDLENHPKRAAFSLILLGITNGLMMNFHMSFGIAVLIALFIYIAAITVSLYRKIKYQDITRRILRLIKNCLFLISGLITAYLPTIIFEFRHGFHQLSAFIYTLKQGFLYQSAVVGQTGMSDVEIVKTVIYSPLSFFKLSASYSNLILALIIFLCLYFTIFRKWQLDLIEKKLLLILTLQTISILFVYTQSKNPVFIYHFIGIEILGLFFLAFWWNKLLLVRIVLSVWFAIQLGSYAAQLWQKSTTDPLSLPSLQTKKYIAETIYRDSENQPFAVFAYSPSIYTYDFDYLFKWLGQDVYGRLPENQLTGSHPVYLIIPKTDEAIKLDFINYRTPNVTYRSEKVWNIPDGSIIIKRIKPI